MIKSDEVRLKLSFSSLEEARGEILMFGGGIKVIAPEALRLSVHDFAEQVASKYVD